MLCSPSALAPFFWSGHPPHGPKPGAQRQARVLENRTRRHRSLIIALPTPQQAPPAGPSSPPSTAGTHKTLWPAQLHQILATRLLSGKTPLKLLQRPRVVLHSPACYMLGSRESSAYPDWTKLTDVTCSGRVSSAFRWLVSTPVSSARLSRLRLRSCRNSRTRFPSLSPHFQFDV